MLRADIRKISILNNSNEMILLKDISFTLKPNHIYTILGENGSGKSTLIKALTLLPDKRFFRIDGRIFWKEKDLSDAGEEELLSLRKNQIRYVFQDCVNSFDPLKRIGYYFNTMADNISKLNQLLEYFNLPEKNKIENLYPYELSGGMAQRIAIVLATVANPQLLILDEPTSAADTAVINLLIHFLNEFVSERNCTVLTVTQDLLFARKVSHEIASIKNLTLTEFHTNQSRVLK